MERVKKNRRWRGMGWMRKDEVGKILFDEGESLWRVREYERNQENGGSWEKMNE